MEKENINPSTPATELLFGTVYGSVKLGYGVCVCDLCLSNIFHSIISINKC